MNTICESSVPAAWHCDIPNWADHRISAPVCLCLNVKLTVRDPYRVAAMSNNFYNISPFLGSPAGLLKTVTHTHANTTCGWLDWLLMYSLCTATEGTNVRKENERRDRGTRIRRNWLIRGDIILYWSWLFYVAYPLVRWQVFDVVSLLFASLDPLWSPPLWASICFSLCTHSSITLHCTLISSCSLPLSTHCGLECW